MGQNDLKEDGNMDFGYRSFGGGGLVTQLCPILVTPWTVACQSPLSMGFPRQEYWNRLAFPSLGDLPGLKSRVSCIAGGFFYQLSYQGNNVVLNSAVQQSDSVIHTHTHTHTCVHVFHIVFHYSLSWDIKYNFLHIQ